MMLAQCQGNLGVLAGFVSRENCNILVWCVRCLCDLMSCVLQAAVERVEKQMDKMGDLATDHRAVQVQHCLWSAASTHFC